MEGCISVILLAVSDMELPSGVAPPWATQAISDTINWMIAFA
jgi:hypothetical protein